MIEQVTRGDGTRIYKTPAGDFPSVTTILTATGDKAALERWRERVGSEEAERVRREAAARGQVMHDQAEHRLLTGEDPDEPSPYYRSLQVAGVFSRIKKIHAVEQFLYHQGAGYAGAVDLVADVQWPREPEPVPTVVDWKSSEKIKHRFMIEDYFCQAMAYWLAWADMRRRGLLDGPMPKRALICIAHPKQKADWHWVREGDRSRWVRQWANRLKKWRSDVV